MDITKNEQIMELWNWFTNSMTIETFINLCVVYFFIIWVSIIIWVTRDITNRTDSILLQFISILLVLILTPLWVFLYLLIRPTKTLFERYYEEIEINLDHLTKSIEGKLEIKEKISIACPNCNYPIENTFKFCPNCKEELRYACQKCDKKVSKDWKVCPYCWEDEPTWKVEDQEKKDTDSTTKNIDKPSTSHQEDKKKESAQKTAPKKTNKKSKKKAEKKKT